MIDNKDSIIKIMLLFPELTERQVSYLYKWAFGLSIADIARIEQTTPEAVKKSLQRTKDAIGIKQSVELRLIFMTRVLCKLLD